MVNVIDSRLAARLDGLRARATEAGDMATVDACIQALRGDTFELFGLADALSAYDRGDLPARGCCCGRCHA